MTAGSVRPGTTAVLAGGTAGIGLALARRLARRGVRVVLLGRRPERGSAAVASIEAAGGEAQFHRVDLSSVADTAAAAADLRSRHPGISLLVQSADVLPMRRLDTPEGVEVSFATNALGRFTMVSALLPVLRDNRGTIAHVALAGAARRLDPAAVPPPPRMGGTRAHMIGQAVNDVIALELAHRVRADGVRVIVTNPGLVDTAIRRDMGRLGRVMDRIVARRAVPADAYAAILEQILDRADPGVLWNRTGEPIQARPALDDPALRAQVWRQLDTLSSELRLSAGPP